ncbi:MAG TPA: agmatinase [Thermoanaerobaculia bacterium]|nr:agmatinase [Thermoanaerobaculia bacterium]HUM29009.1 agmatinase [Thermoanaerobaculia bacterium]HXK67435.1 agmatinase [Thermoanaerobaculia bacterium]
MQFLPEISFETFQWVILPVPFEATTSYLKGTARGPEAIIESSAQLEDFDTMAGREAIRDHGFYTDDTWEFSGSLIEVGKRVEFWLEKGKKILALGGEHSITIPIVPAYKKYYPDLAVVHFDAHADLRDAYEGSSLSHACAMRRVLDHVPIYSLGLRAYSQEEKDLILERSIPVLHAWEMDDTSRVIEFLDQVPPNVYISFDVDAVDPSEIPTTGTPQPGGISFRQSITALGHLFEHRNIVGADVVETRPIAGLEYGVFTVASLCHFMLGRG